MLFRKEQKVYDPDSGKAVVLNGRSVFHPSREELEADGWQQYNEAYDELNAACDNFMAVCKAIGELIGDPDFSGGFDEMQEFEASEASRTPEGIMLAIRWMAADKQCTYLASKVGMGQPEWWYWMRARNQEE